MFQRRKKLCVEDSNEHTHDNGNYCIIKCKNNFEDQPSLCSNICLLCGITLSKFGFICKEIKNGLRNIFPQVEPLPCWETYCPHIHSKRCSYYPLYKGLPYSQEKRPAFFKILCICIY